MNKKKIAFSITAVAILGFVGVLFIRSIVSSYEHITKNYTKIVSEEVYGIPDGSILYVGRETCPVCVSFIPKFSDALSEDEHSVYYLDTQNEKEHNFVELKQFIDKESITSVPTLILKKNGELIKKSFDAEASIEEIKKFIFEEKI
ncbi:thioredoxin [Enterococcus faecalis]